MLMMSNNAANLNPIARFFATLAIENVPEDILSLAMSGCVFFANKEETGLSLSLVPEKLD